MKKLNAIYFLALGASACGVSNSDPAFWQQTQDLGGKMFQLPAPGSTPADTGGESATGAAGATTNPDPTAMPTANPGAGGGQPNPIPSGTGEVPPVGAGGAAGMFVGGGSGGTTILPPGSGGTVVTGSGGVTTTGAGGMAATGNSGKCTFTFDATTVTARGTYAPRNVGGIWITDSSNKFVKTLSVWGAIRLSNATAWVQASGNNRTDAVTGATRTSHGAIQGKWDCTDVSHNAVPDGSYTVHITFTESDANPFFGGTPIQASVNFSKSAAGGDATGTDTANFTGMHATLTVP
jgi:hypothetical protein